MTVPATPVSLFKTAVSRVMTGGEPVIPMYGPVAGGIITNPRSAEDQGLDLAEALFINVTGAPAETLQTATTVAIQPGQTYVINPGLTTNVSVNAVSSGHRFSGVVYQPPVPYPPVPQPGTFPPAGPTTLTQLIPSYLYQEYADDQDLQAFVASYNALGQGYLTWFATIGLPVYTSPEIATGLLDLVAQGIYGMVRPALSSGRNRDIGPLNTYAYNTLAYNRRRSIGPTDVTVTTDDIFKRIMTWNFYKGDGDIFNTRWLKRRIMRFLTGPNGTAPNIDQTYVISVTFGVGVISIRITVGTREITGGALYNRMGFNRVAYNSLQTRFIPGPSPLPLSSVLKEALESGVLLLPFQYQFTVAI